MMMPKIDYINGTVEDFTVVLSNRNLDKQGQILNVQDFRCKGNLSSAQEISFSVYKYVDGVKTHLWDDIKNLKIVWVKELDTFFETRISLTESTNTVKKITGVSLCEAELSQTPMRNTEINSEDDIARPDYVVTTFYNPENAEGSLLHRVLSFAPHYSIKYVDKSLWNIQRTFSIDEKSIYDFLVGECAEQFNCLFRFNSKDRTISVYDLYTVCQQCGHRGEYLDVCPECGGKHLTYFGKDTTIFVSADNLTDEITFDTDVDSIKNCMYLKTGDEVMDAAVVACNPNGSRYVYYYSEEQKADMPTELTDKLKDYDESVESYSEEYQTLSEELYKCIDDILYYQSGMMPTVEIPEVNASTEVVKLTEEALSPIALSVVNSYTSTATVNSALKNYAKVFVKSGFVKVEIDTGKFTYGGTDKFGYGTWTGRFKITNYSDKEDIAYSDTLTIDVNDDYETFLNQKILKNIANNNTDDDSIYDVLSIDDLDKFKQALTLYSYNRLESFADAIQGIINILIEENQGQSESTYYSQIYIPYYNKLQACQAEMNVRSATIQECENRQAEITKRQSEIQSELNLQKFLGEDLYKLFCTYRREDTYQNENFISDGLSNTEIFEKAKEFIELAKQEIVKSGEHQHSISSNLYNLLIMKEFAPIKDMFELGNWIRCKVDDNIYRLRLVTYEVNGSSLSNINTEFSDMTKTASGVNDVRSILSKAQSMATTIPYVEKQAEQGQKAQDFIVDTLENGLNSALVSLKNNDTEEVTYGKHGILCRSWDDVEEDYSPEQLRITHNLLAYTSTGWKDVSLGLGKHDYYYYDNNNTLIKSTGYGLSSKFVTAGYIWGSQIIGGEIYSQNYSPTAGTYLNLNDGTFSWAGGKIKYDGNIVSLSGVILKWEDMSGAPTSLSDFENDTGFQTKEQVTTITEDTIATTNIIAKNLKVQSANIEGKIHADSVDAENITGTTIIGKTIVVGGENNGNGSIVVKDEYGASICTIDVNGITLKSKNYVVRDEFYILSGRYINSEYAPYVVQYASGVNSCIGTNDTSTVDGYVGGYGYIDNNNGSWGVDTGSISVDTYHTLKIDTYINRQDSNMPTPYLYLYGDGVLIKSYKDNNLLNALGMNNFNDNYGAAEFDVSLYKTISVKFIAEYKVLQAYQNGILASGITTSGFTIESGYLQAGIGADNDESNDTQVSIRNIDFTNYSKMDIVLNYNAGANYGSGTVAYGIDSYWTTALPGSYAWTSTTITLDISSYTGTHYIGFGLAAENNSSEPTWGAWANVWIKEIKLYNDYGKQASIAVGITSLSLS